MAFPVIESTAVSNAGDTYLDVAMPPGVVAGDLLICLFTCDGGGVTFTAPGWSELFEGSGTQASFAAFWRIADGAADSMTITIDQLTKRTKCAIVFRVSGHGHSASVPPEAAWTPTTTVNIYPQPPSLTASWGVMDTLWLAGYGMDDGSKNLVSYPIDYTLHQTAFDSDLSASVLSAIAGNASAVATESPGPFTVDAQDQWLACTIAVMPGGGASEPRKRLPLLLTPW